MRNIAYLNPSKINDKGYYFDVDRGEMFPLSDEEILAAREFFHMPMLAKERVVGKRQVSQNRNYKIDKHQKYNDGKHKKRKNNNTKGQIRTIVVGLSLCIVTVYGTFLVTNVNSNASFDTKGVEYSYMEEKTPSSEKLGTIISYQNLNASLTNENSELLPETVLSSLNTDEILMDENAERREWVKKYCDIYQVNFDIVYNKLVELTNNFTDTNYLNGYILGVTCKGQEVYANSEEELILYFVRCVKQIPSQLGINSSNLYINNGYHSANDYAALIGYYNRLLGTDPILSYAIVQSETSWDSDLFLESNNPAGLRTDGKWWTFSTKEEGFIELALEILKYNRKGAYTIEEIGSIHAPIEDGNINWIPNVTSVYNTVLTDENLLTTLQGSIENGYTR